MFDIKSDSLLSMQELCEKLGVSKSAMYRIRRNEIPNQVPFPEPVVWLGHGDRPRWSAKEINSWIYLQGESYKDRKE